MRVAGLARMRWRLAVLGLLLRRPRLRRPALRLGRALLRRRLGRAAFLLPGRGGGGGGGGRAAPRRPGGGGRGGGPAAPRGGRVAGGGAADARSGGAAGVAAEAGSGGAAGVAAEARSGGAAGVAGASRSGDCSAGAAGTSSSSVRRNRAASGPSRMLARLPLAIGENLLREIAIGLGGHPVGIVLQDRHPLDGRFREANRLLDARGEHAVAEVLLEDLDRLLGVDGPRVHDRRENALDVGVRVLVLADQPLRGHARR